MKFIMFVLPTVPGTLEERQHLWPIGRDNERYQQMLNKLRSLVVLAEDAHGTCPATSAREVIQCSRVHSVHPIVP